MKKDVLAGGYARTAQFIGGVGEDDFSRNLSSEARNEFIPEALPTAQRKSFRPAGDVLLIRRAEAKLGNGILVVADSVEKEQPSEGLILSVGPKVTAFSQGDYVAFGKYAGTLFKLNGEELLLAKEDEMLGTIEDESEIPLDTETNIGVCCSQYGINGNGA
jgi:chaperonin GroES